jgi:DNA polymerase
MANWTSHHVFWRGEVPCDILFIGEAPGREEDRIGVPFQGAAGGVLQMWLRQALEDIEFKYAITNLVCCRPVDRPRGPNRVPTLLEQAKCFPRLEYFVEEIAKPKGIVAMGRTARESDFISKTMVPYIVTRHPAYYCYSGGEGKDQAEKIVSFAMELNL